MYNYAQLDRTNKVVGLSQLSAQVIAENLIPITDFDQTLMGKYYDLQTKSFFGVTVSIDKTTIKANGTDATTITATVPSVLSSITFYYNDTGQPIQTVTPTDGAATIQITASSPGTIQVRAGDWQFDRQNIVTITAS